MTYRLHPFFWAVPALCVLGAGGLVWLAGSAFGFRGPESGIFILLALGLCGLAFWTSLRMRHAFILDDEGITLVAPGTRRVFAWDELRSIDDWVEGFGQYSQVIYRVKAGGGRSFRFTDRSITNARGLASRIENAILGRRQALKRLGNPERGAPQTFRAILRKRYRESPRFVRVFAVVFGLVVGVFAVWFDWRADRLQLAAQREGFDRSIARTTTDVRLDMIRLAAIRAVLTEPEVVFSDGGDGVAGHAGIEWLYARTHAELLGDLQNAEAWRSDQDADGQAEYVDGYGHPFVLRSRAGSDGGGVSVWSVGPDGRPDTDDDHGRP